MSGTTPRILGAEDKVSIVNVSKPRHAECHSLEESRAFQPWEVDLRLRMNAVDPREHSTFYYVRARDQGHAWTLAFSMFHRWEKVEKGIGDSMYPDVVGAVLTVMDEQEWDFAWKCAKRHLHKKAGMDANPSCFTIMEAVKI